MKKIIALMLSAAIAMGGVISANVCADEYEPYRCMGDSNGDKIVDGKDASDVLTMYSKSSVGKTAIASTLKQKCDVNCDGIIDGKDATDILSYYSFTSVGGNAQPDTYYMKNMLKNGDKTALINAAENLYDLAAFVANGYSMGTRFSLSNTEYIEKGGNHYNLVTDPKIKSMDDVYADCYSLFAEKSEIKIGDTRQSIGILNHYVQGDNGKVYSLIGNRGSFFEQYEITGVKSITSNSVTFNVVCSYLWGTINDDFTLKIQSDGTLKITEFRIPY